MSLDIVSFASPYRELKGGKTQRGPARHKKIASCNLALINNEDTHNTDSKEKILLSEALLSASLLPISKRMRKILAKVENAVPQKPRSISLYVLISILKNRLRKMISCTQASKPLIARILFISFT